MKDFPPPPSRDPIVDQSSPTPFALTSWLKWFGLVARDLQTDDVAPAVPTGLALTTGLENVAQTTVAYITATWDNNTEDDMDFYTIRIFKGAETDGQEYSVEVPETGDPSFKFSPLIPNATYRVDVRAIDDSGNGSDFSPEETIASAGDTTAPATPTGLAAAAAGVKQIRVTWTANTEADLAGYELHASTTTGFTPSVSTRIAFASDATTYTYDTPAYTTYYFKLRAKDQNGNYSDYTSQVSATSVQVVTADITDANITTAKIADATITTAKIADATITTAKIADANITNAKIGNLAVDTLQLSNNAVTSLKRQLLSSASQGYGPIAATSLGQFTITHSLGRVVIGNVMSGNANMAIWPLSSSDEVATFGVYNFSAGALSPTATIYYM